MILSRLEHPSNPVPRTEDQKPCAAGRAEQEHPVLSQVQFSFLIIYQFAALLFIIGEHLWQLLHENVTNG
jgi:hypothetical protein